ncbi:MAG TPA: hypothetical protein VEO54_02830 [Thermoanaerobaculia bacterium]|nr:hypothetical protein [Thermoanaerobaculia bacterium]
MTAGLGLVVPVRLDALTIGLIDALEDPGFAPAYADFDSLPYPRGPRTAYLSSLAVRAPFTNYGPLVQGIHLHWQLPNALRRGAYGSSGELTLPKVPDRWLVTRIVADLAAPSSPIQLRSWVLESNYLATASTWSPTTIPWDAAPQPETYRWLGRVYDYDEWRAGGGQGTYWDNLTSVGYGIPDFAAYYPNCVNVFGFVDQTLNDAALDAATTAIAYAVTGWYANEADDPLRAGPVDGWLFDASAGETPEHTLCQGFVWALSWRPAGAYFPDHATAIAPAIAIGNTPAEAFSALAATKVTEPLQNVETILDALQLGVLPWLDQPGGSARLEEALFNDAFAAYPGGVVWQLEPAGGSDAAAQRALLALDTTAAEALEELNRLQRTYDDEAARMVSLQSQIFADWNKYMVVKYTPQPGYPPVDSVRGFLDREMSALAAMQSTLAALQGQLDAAQQSVRALLPAELVLASAAAPRYYQPDDPVVVLSGDGVPAQPPDARPAARCILTTQILEELELPASLVPGSAAVTIAASDLPAVNADALPYPAIAALVPAMMLADPQLAPVLTAILAAEGGTANPAVLDAGATSAAIAAAQTQLLTGETPSNGITFHGLLPQTDIGFLQWDIPWHPVALSWRFVYSPLVGTGGELSPDFVLDNFTFDETSLDLEPKAPAFAEALQQYSGTVLLSPDAAINLQRQIVEYLRYETDPELEAILRQLGEYPLLAQSLGGFDAALLMLALTLQLPVADPAATDQFTYDFSNIRVRGAVGDQNKSAPLTSNEYNPLRAGKLTLQRLDLIDEFGRVRSVSLSRLIVADTIPTLAPSELLPPLRVTQPAKLDLRWLSAYEPAREASNLPVAGPICGWVVPNHLDDSLMFYDAGGAAIGSLTRSGDATRTIWQDAPGTGTPGGTMDAAFTGRNAVLSAFALSVRDHGPAYIDALIRTIDRTKIFIAPRDEQQNLQTAVLMGAPLAITQARVALRLFGLPSAVQSYAALSADIAGGDPLQRTTNGFPSVRFPLILGSLSQFDDGLIGYFRGSDFSTLYAGAADGESPHIVQPAMGTLTVAAADESAVVTMLVDPRAGVHAFTGIAPVKVLTIAPDAVAVAMRRMDYTFLTTPVLSLESGLAVPRPAQVSNATWEWIALGTEQTWVQTPIADLNLEATLQTPRALVEGWMKLKLTEES